MGVATIEVPPPPSVNHANRGRDPRRRHAAKRSLQGQLATLLLAANVPRPIPGDRVHASAHILFPTNRRRDEDNYRSGLSKALGDALAPAPTKEERDLGLEPMFAWLTDDTPQHFRFGEVTFGVTDRVPGSQRRRPAIALVTLRWGDDLVEVPDLVHVRIGLGEREARQLADDLVAGRGGHVAARQLEQLWLLAVFTEQRRRTDRAERADFDRRADKILAALDPVP